jgi:hypothetical protein
MAMWVMRVNEKNKIKKNNTTPEQVERSER